MNNDDKQMKYKMVYCQKCNKSLQNKTIFLICDRFFCSLDCRNAVYKFDERGIRLIKKTSSLANLNEIKN